ncbi:MAG: enolase C-terminal domain-like protein [Pseudomonadota bacterium]
MKIDEIRAYRVRLPFLVDFSHALRKRSSVKNIVVEVIAQKGDIIGTGEGAPRSYVTGETQESAVQSIRCFTGLDNFPWEVNDISRIWDFIDGLPNGKKHNAAICALETALLDAFGHSQGKNIIEYFPGDFFTGHVHYGVPIPLAGKQRILELCRLIKTMEINTLRLKFGKDLAQNKGIIEAVHSEFGANCDLRVDINCAWNSALALNHVPLIQKYKIKAVEQPMMPNELAIADFSGLMQRLGVALMADESACTLEEVMRIIKEGYYNMVNVRLSKCGGFRNSFKIIDFLRENGIPFQIGCQLGESGILSAAGRVLCLLCRDAVYYDGSYDEFLLKENTTLENVTFGLRGKAGPLEGPGLGVKVGRQHVKRLCNDSAVLTVSRP